MPERKEKLDRFTAKILAEASQEAKKAIEELKRSREQARSRAEDQVLLEAYQYIHREVGRIKAEAGREVSRHMLENKRTLAIRREEMARESFALVRAKIAAYTRTPDYTARMQALLRQALAQLPGAQDAVVYLRAEDMALESALRQAAGNVPLRFVPGELRLGGLVAESQALGLRADASFDSQAQALSGHFAELFGISLADQ